MSYAKCADANFAKSIIRLVRSLAVISLISLFSLPAWEDSAIAQGSAFTYQGRLNSGGSAASGNYDLSFALYNDSTVGTQQGNALTNNGVAVTNGLFTTTLDFGSTPFTGQPLWLQIGVRTNGSGAFSALSPRQPLTPAPYAIMANSASNLLGPLPAGQLSGAYSGAIAFTNAANTFNGAFTGDGSGLTNVPGAVVWSAAGSAQQAVSDSAYLATNDSQQTVITLPASPNIGDTIRVSGIGAGGWRVSQNGSQTILAGNFFFSGSSGTLWTPTLTASGGFSAITVSSDGRNIAAMNTSTHVYFSGDSGITWSLGAGSGGASAMAGASDGTKLVSAGNSHIYTSPDGGKSWITTSAPGLGWYGVASSGDGNKLYATINGGPFPMYYSANGGATWTTNNMGSRSWGSLITCSADGARVAAVANGNLYYSTDSGNTYVYTTNLSAGWSGIALFPDGSRIAAVSGGTVYLFQNGLASYTTHSIGGNVNHFALSTDGSRMVGASASGSIYMSKDFGATWSPTSAPSTAWTAVASSADGGRWVATAGAQIYIAQPATTAGTSGFLVGAQGATVELQYLGNNYFLPLSSQGAISAY